MKKKMHAISSRSSQMKEEMFSDGWGAEILAMEERKRNSPV